MSEKQVEEAKSRYKNLMEDDKQYDSDSAPNNNSGNQ